MRQKFKREVIDQSLNDMRVELSSEFDRNFERKGFFGKKWVDRKGDSGRGSLLSQTGGLRRSITARRHNMEIAYSSHLPYARIHNEGGEIEVTKKMKGYFRWKLHEEGGYKKKKDGSRRNNKYNRDLSEKAKFYAAMAAKKEGEKIKIPQRQFLGASKETDKIIREIADNNIKEFFIKNKLIKK